MKRTLLSGIPVLLALLLAAHAALGQVPADLRFELLDEVDGLSSHIITDVQMDGKGFLWIATLDGLNRYDGHSFRVFRHDPADPGSLLFNNGQHLAVGPKGDLWVSYLEGGLSRYDADCQCFTHYPPAAGDPAKPPASQMAVLHIDTAGVVYFSGPGLGLSMLYPDSNKVVRYDLPFIAPHYPESDRINYNGIQSIYEAPDGLLWLCTANGLYSYDRSTRQFSYKQYPFPGKRKTRSDYFLRLIPDGVRGFWLIAWAGGVCYFDRASESFTTWKYNENEFLTSIGNIVNDFTRKSDHEFWIATSDRGPGIFNTTTKTFRFLWDESSPFALNSTFITYGPDNVLFLVTEEGLFKHNPASNLFRFQPLPIARSQNNLGFHISDVLEIPEQHAVLFATILGDGLNIMDTRTGKLTALPVENKPQRIDQWMHIYDLLRDRNGRIWVASRDYLYEYDNIKRRLLRLDRPFPAEEDNRNATFRSMTEDPEGRIWVVTRQGGLHLFSPDSKKLGEKLNDTLARPEAPAFIKHITFDRQGGVWLQGLGKTCVYTPRSGAFSWPLGKDFLQLGANSVSAMTTDRAGNIWLAIDNKGLLRIQPNDPRPDRTLLITEADGLPSARISNMEADHEGNLWMSTIKGVVYMHTASLNYRQFNHTQGVDKNTQFMFLLQGGNNSFYLTTPGRYCRVDFQEVKKTSRKPQVYIDRFKVFNIEKPTRFAPDTEIRIAPGEDFFSFDFGCLDFADQTQHRFSYILEGWDKDWIDCGTRRYASFTNLDGGHYTFKVRVANSEGIWGDPVEVPVFIETPVYQKPWFAVLITLLIAGLIYALYLYRIRQIEQTEQLKTEFNRQLAETRMEALRAQMNPHFIFNCLNSINRYIIKSDVKTSSLYLTKFAKLIRLILDNSEHKTVSLDNEIEALRLYVDMEALRFDHKFTYEISVDPDVDTSHIEVPPLLVQPYVENAIWHGLLHKDGDGHLSVRFYEQDERLLCTVTDNGIGRAKALEYKSMHTATRKSHGMKLTEARLHMQGEGAGAQEIIDLFDDAGNPAGTCVVITFPVGNGRR